MSRHPKPSPAAVSIELEVPFHDVDLLQVVWHGHYCKYLELGRTALFRSRQLDATDMITLGYRFLITESHLRHIHSLRYADRLRVTSWFAEIENRIRIAYDVVNLTAGRTCTQASTVLVTVSDAGELCLETPPAILQRLRAPGPGTAA